MNQLAFYIMNYKGYVTLKSFIDKFGADSIAYIVSSEDKALKKDYFDEISALAKQSKLRFFDKSDDLEDLENNHDVYKFVIGWRWLIRNEKKLIIFHDSILPKYRGFAPLVNSLINKESKIGVSALQASDSYDQGDIIAQETIKINYPIKINQAIEQITPLYFNLVENIFKEIVNNNAIKARKQNEEDATYSSWLDDKDYFIDWSWSAEKIKRFVDAVSYPYDGAKTHLDRKIINLVDVDLIDDVVIENRSRHLGKIIFLKNKQPVVICQKGLLKLVEIRDDQNNLIDIKFRSRFN